MIVLVAFYLSTRMVYIPTQDDECAYDSSTMNNDVHLQALIEKSLQLKIIQIKYPEHDMDIRWAAAYFKTKHIR